MCLIYIISKNDKYSNFYLLHRRRSNHGNHQKQDTKQFHFFKYYSVTSSQLGLWEVQCHLLKNTFQSGSYEFLELNESLSMHAEWGFCIIIMIRWFKHFDEPIYLQ